MKYEFDSLNFKTTTFWPISSENTHSKNGNNLNIQFSYYSQLFSHCSIKSPSLAKVESTLATKKKTENHFLYIKSKNLLYLTFHAFQLKISWLFQNNSIIIEDINERNDILKQCNATMQKSCTKSLKKFYVCHQHTTPCLHDIIMTLMRSWQAKTGQMLKWQVLVIWLWIWSKFRVCWHHLYLLWHQQLFLDIWNL